MTWLPPMLGAVSHAPWDPPRPPANPAPPARRGPGRLLIVLAAGLAVLLLTTIAGVSWLSRPPTGAASGRAPASNDRPSTATSAPTSASTTAAAPSLQPTSAAPESGPAQVPSSSAKPRRPQVGLEKNGLYAIDLSGRGTCKARIRRPMPPVEDAALAAHLRTLVSCLTAAFRGPLTERGFTLTTPKVKTFKGSTRTPCGLLSSRSNPAFYCAGTIYWPVSSDDAREAYTFARLGYLGLAAHEFGHHLQATTGMLYVYGARYREADAKERYRLSRRLELQAQCFEGVFLAHTSRSIRLSSRDRVELRAWHSYTGDEDPPSSRRPDHGSSRAQLAWLNRGLAGADLGRCNTWVASGKSVR